MTEPFQYSAGPPGASIALVGEAWGAQDALLKQPFVGSSGQELTRMLKDGGIDRKNCFITNVLPLHPPANNIDFLCVKKGELPSDYAQPHLKLGKYLKPEYLCELKRLKAELEFVKPNVVIALGNTACWALLSATNIGSIRGSTSYSSLIEGQKILPTYHPSGVMREWSWRVICVSDFMKAKRESLHPEIIRPKRWVLVDPTLAEIAAWAQEPAEIYSVDIETFRGQISCIGFAKSTSDAIVIKFLNQNKGNWSHWDDPKDETRAWSLVAQMLHSPVPKLFQNGLFDLQYLFKMGFRPRNCLEDTMLLSHALWPEMRKGLGFLASVHSNESSWKLMVRHSTKEPEKKDA